MTLAKTPTLITQSGSYLASDVTLLLDIVDESSVADVPVQQKEALIQSGAQHYSDMLTLEQRPTATHEQLFQQALEQGRTRMATDIANLAYTLHDVFKAKVTTSAPLILVSLVRAGLPVGVLLQRALSDKANPYALPSQHYGMSIIRDRGLDPVAMQTILAQHPDSPIVFIDGWTGKGAIYGELVSSLAIYADPSNPYYNNIFHQNQSASDNVIPLVTLADPAGVAWLAASNDDWLIPSGLLGSTVSGLISRTLFTEPSADLKEGLHRSVLYHELIDYDHSLAFIETIDTARQQLDLAESLLTLLPTHQTPRYSTQAIIKSLATRYNIANMNRIKPTIAEATRALLRRDPEQVLLASPNHPDTVLLRHICTHKNIDVQVLGAEILPYQAVTIIKKRS
jgi:hypothetical protein